MYRKLPNRILSPIQKPQLRLYAPAKKREPVDETPKKLDHVISLVHQLEELKTFFIQEIQKAEQIQSGLQDEFEQKLIEAEEAISLIEKGDEGDDGHTPTEEELIAIIKPLIPAPLKGDAGIAPTAEDIASLLLSNSWFLNRVKGTVPVAGLDFPFPKKGDDGKHADPLTVIETIKKDKHLKVEHIEGLQQTLGAIKSQISEQGGWKMRGGGDTVSAGSNISITTVNGVKRISSTGGSATIYTETPTGTIDGANKTYTTIHTITTVIGMWINGQFIHPSEYTASGAGFTMGTALNTSLSGTGFTISYT